MPGEDDDVRISDLALIRRTAAGDATAFSVLARRHQAAVYRFASALVPADEAEKVLQEAFLAARRTAHRYQDEAPVRTWLLALARQVAHRRHPRRAPASLDSPSLRELGRAAGWGRTDDPNRFAERLFDRQRLEETLAALPPEDREVLILCDLEGLSGEEAAAVAGFSAAVTKTRLLRARLRLIARLKEDNGDGR